jgi:broad specificity phosphatase PhoE
MTRLHLITHAHTAIDPAQDAAGWQLSATGHRQAEALTALPLWESVDRILISSEAKTRLTVAPLLARRALPVVSDRRFDEVQRPGWVEKYAEHVRAFFAAPEQTVGGWEPAAHALHRFLAGLRDHLTPDGGEEAALVSHGLVLSLYRAHLLGQAPPDFEAWRQLGFAAVATVDLHGPAWINEFTPVAASPLRGQG